MRVCCDTCSNWSRTEWLCTEFKGDGYKAVRMYINREYLYWYNPTYIKDYRSPEFITEEEMII